MREGGDPAGPDGGGPAEPEWGGPAEPGDDEGPGGIFPSWRALYLTLIAYTGFAVAVLLLLTHLLNAGGP